MFFVIVDNDGRTTTTTYYQKSLPWRGGSKGIEVYFNDGQSHYFVCHFVKVSYKSRKESVNFDWLKVNNTRSDTSNASLPTHKKVGENRGNVYLSPTDSLSINTVVASFTLTNLSLPIRAEQHFRPVSYEGRLTLSLSTNFEGLDTQTNCTISPSVPITAALCSSRFYIYSLHRTQFR